MLRIETSNKEVYTIEGLDEDQFFELLWEEEPSDKIKLRGGIVWVRCRNASIYQNRIWLETGYSWINVASIVKVGDEVDSLS